MAQRSTASLRVITEHRPPPLLPSAVLGMLIFVFAEAMMFAGLISAFTIVKAGALGWPPPGQPRLPIQTTAFNTLMLLGSAAVLLHANRVFGRDREAARRPLFAAIGLGAFFVLFQGFEWVRLLRHGLTLSSSNYGAFFYLIVGIHALHAVAGLTVLGRAAWKLQTHVLSTATFAAAQVFWYFVVGLWPILYYLVYL